MKNAHILDVLVVAIPRTPSTPDSRTCEPKPQNDVQNFAFRFCSGFAAKLFLRQIFTFKLDISGDGSSSIKMQTKNDKRKFRQRLSGSPSVRVYSQLIHSINNNSDSKSHNNRKNDCCCSHVCNDMQFVWPWIMSFAHARSNVTHNGILHTLQVYFSWATFSWKIKLKHIAMHHHHIVARNIH